MADVNVRVPAEARDRFADAAAAEGLSLYAYLARLADMLPTPAERATRAEQVCVAQWEWNGCNPAEADTASLDAELDRRLEEAMSR